MDHAFDVPAHGGNPDYLCAYRPRQRTRRGNQHAAFYPRWLLYTVVLMLMIANTINIAADLSAMGNALRLLIGGSERWYATGFGIFSLLPSSRINVMFASSNGLP
jgi:hypothetical protein